jgi:HK97 family phage portal protein
MNPYNQFICGNDGGAVEITNSVSGMRNPTEWYYEWATGGTRNGAPAVNGYTALTHCPIWQGINIIAGDIGQTPLKLMRNRFSEQKEHPAWQLLQREPNGLQVASTFLETLVQWALMWGQGCAWIQYRGSQPYKLTPLRPDCLWKELIAFEDQEVLLYHYYSPLRGGSQYVFFPWEIIDIPGLTADGVCGYELHRIARETIAHGLSLEKHGNAIFQNGAVPGGVLEAPAGAAISKDKEARANLRREWNAIHRGPDKAGEIAILWEGIVYKQTSHNNVDAQWLGAKQDSVYDAARLLNLPPHKLGAMQDSSVRANLEEQNSDYAQRTLSRWYNRMSEEFARKLLTRKEWVSGEYEFVWDVEAFLKADIDTLTTVIDRLVKATILNPNEGRAKLRLPPREGGDEYGSPAINPNPKRPEDGKESPDNGRPKGATTKNAHRELLHDHILVLLKRESLALNDAAAGAKLFIKWLDEFYLPADGSEPKIVALFETVMGTTIRACCAAGLDVRGFKVSILNYASKRHAQLLEACSSVTKEQLPATIKQFSNSNQSLIAQGLLATALGETNGTND